MADIPTLDPGATPVKRMRLRYAGTCAHCGSSLAKGEEAFYDREAKVVYCVECPGTAEAYVPRFALDPRPQVEPNRTPVSPETPPEPESYVEGIPGASARAQQQRRLAFVQERHPLIAEALAGTYGDHIAQAWETGAEGEERLGATLNEMAGPFLRVLHDRSIPTTRVNIDHVVIAPSGVHVIDAKKYRDHPESRGGTLYVGGRNRSDLIEQVDKQVRIVQAALTGHPGVQARGHLCFVNETGSQPDFIVNGIGILGPDEMIRTLNAHGPIDAGEIAAVHQQLTEALPAR